MKNRRIIKVGQIYKDSGKDLLVITAIDPHKSKYDVIFNNGETYYTTKWQDFETYCEFVTEYPTWQEAVNSKEFKNGRI